VVSYPGKAPSQETTGCGYLPRASGKTAQTPLLANHYISVVSTSEADDVGHTSAGGGWVGSIHLDGDAAEVACVRTSVVAVTRA
jgi:hypothetical protein